MQGKVWLVGAGPGDPGLLTVRAAGALRAADVVVYDRLVNPVLLNEAPPQAERIDAGKQPGRATLEQAQINELLVRYAREGKRVVRLKGGDPFIFGRGGEEAEACREAGVGYEVVPGISSATAVPAYAGIPVTHRGVAASFTVLTGHEDPAKPESQLDWAALAHGADTLVCLMGVETLAATADRLIRAGKSAATPAAVISQGTLPQQRTIVGTLGDIAEKVRASGLRPPAVAVFGEVVRLRAAIEWFEARPLFGKRVLVTRTREQASDLRTRLEAEGAEVIELPTLEIVDGASPQLLERVIEALADGEYSWVIFTSSNAVRRFFDAVSAAGRDSRAFGESRIAVVGPATAEALRSYGIRPDLMPQRYEGTELAALLRTQDLARRRVLLPRAETARPELLQSLREQGAEVEEVPLYVSQVPRHPDARVLERIRAGDIDVLTFASSSAVRNLVKLLGEEIAPLRSATVACIGPVTAHTAERCGLRAEVVAAEATIPGLVEALRRHWSRPA